MPDHVTIRDSGLFDAEWYRARYPDAAALDMPALDHYLRFGLGMNRSPGPGFDADFYADCHPDAALPSLLHYLETGRAAGYAPIPPAELSAVGRRSARAGLLDASLEDFTLEVRFWVIGAADPVIAAGTRRQAASPDVAEGWCPRGARVFAARMAVSDLDLEAGLRIEMGPVLFPFMPPEAAPAPMPPPPILADGGATVAGRLDHVGRRMASGWAMVPDRSDRVGLLLLVDGQPHAVLQTGLPRPDIAETRGGDGLAGFRLDLAPNLAPCAEIAVEIAPISAKGALSPSRRVLRPSGDLVPLAAPEIAAIHPTGWTDDPVSVIVLNRNGEGLLQAMFASARETGDLAACEWIVVDHRSDDGSVALCEGLRDDGIDIRVIRRDGNFSFSESCNLGASEARGSILLFANNDLIFRQPFLPILRRHFADGRCGILGAKLRDHPCGGEYAPVQHLGVHISPRLSGDMIRPFEARATAETPDLGAGAVHVPAVTGAFLAIRGDRFDALGRFDEGYAYGMEDVDLCLRATAAGMAVLCDHGFDIVHHRGATRDSAPSRTRREANYRRFNQSWAAALRHVVPADTAFWTGARPVLGVFDDTAAPAHMHLRGLPDSDVAGISHLGGVVPDPLVLTGTGPFLRHLDDGPDRLRIAIKCPAPEGDTARWGDYHFAQSLADALRRLGHAVRVDCREHWAAPIGDTDDAVIVLRGLLPYKPRAHQVNILWIISHPGDLPPAETEGYDVVYSASQLHARLLSDLAGRDVAFLPQCTDTRRFAFDAGRIGRRADRVLFVGNARGVHREAVRWCAEGGVDLHLYGKGWRPFVEPHLLRGANIPNEVLADFYAASRIVLCDHWQDMRNLGFVSNRVMDVLAVGGALAVDDVAGLEALVPGGYGIFRDARDLRALVDAEPDLSERGIEARATVARHIAARHSFDARAHALSDALAHRGDRRSLAAGAKTAAALYSIRNSAEFETGTAGE